jgi:hypothetical protein
MKRQEGGVRPWRHMEERGGGVRRSIAVAAGRQRPRAGGRAWRVVGHPKQGTLGWVIGGVSTTVRGGGS